MSNPNRKLNLWGIVKLWACGSNLTFSIIPNGHWIQRLEQNNTKKQAKIDQMRYEQERLHYELRTSRAETRIREMDLSSALSRIKHLEAVGPLDGYMNGMRKAQEILREVSKTNLDINLGIAHIDRELDAFGPRVPK